MKERKVLVIDDDRSMTLDKWILMLPHSELAKLSERVKEVYDTKRVTRGYIWEKYGERLDSFTDYEGGVSIDTFATS